MVQRYNVVLVAIHSGNVVRSFLVPITLVIYRQDFRKYPVGMMPSVEIRLNK